jgi:large subunit ribosomal protein L17
MYKRKKARQLGLKRDQRKALLRSLAEALFNKERIETTEAKAKELSTFAEKLITKGKQKTLASQRDLAKLFADKLVRKITGEIAQRYQTRNGGYTRIMKLAPRKNDGARIAIIELVK